MVKKKLDKHHLEYARQHMSKAQGELLIAQSYLSDAGCGEALPWPLERMDKIMRRMNELSESIGHIAQDPDLSE